jgi:Protein kinase domain
MGIVYEATHLRLRQRLAIKVLRPDVPEFDEVVARFEREARAAAQLQSIHTARVIDVDTLPNGLPYIVLEFLDGRDLDAELEATGPMAAEDAVDIVLQVADAMAEAHALGIVHRDLKPSNLFVCRVEQRSRPVVKVLDFGISKVESEQQAQLTPSHEYFGTPYYAAPEQLRAASTADARSDVWSLGAILFELLTGRTPFVGTPTSVIAKVVSDPVPWPTELRPELPRELARIVICSLQRDPQERFQNMRELALALEPFGPKQTVEAAAGPPAARGKLGEILVADGLLTQADLLRALAEQRRSGKLLGRVLLDLRLVSQVDLLTALAKQQGVIVTPETRSPMERDRRRREADTMPRPSSSGRPQRRWPGAWLMAAAVGLPVGVALAIWLSTLMKSRAAGPGLVETASAPTLPNLVLAPATLSAATTFSAASAPTFIPTGVPPPRSSRPAPAHSAPASSHQAFDPNGI